MANEGGGIGNLDYLGDPRGENKQFFPDKNIGPTYEEAVKFLTKERSDGLSFNESEAKALVISLGVGPVLKLSELVQRGASGTAQAFRDMGSFIQDPSGATINGVKFLINSAVKGWNKVNPINSIDIKVDAKGNFLPKGDSDPVNSKGIADIIIGPGSSGDVTYPGKKEQESPEFVERSQPGSDVTEAELIARDDERVRVTNPATGEKWTEEEIDAKNKENIIQAATDELESRPGYIGDNSVMSQFDVGGNREGKTNIPDGKLSARESETMRGGGIFPNMGANRQEYGGGNYGPSSGFDTMSNYFWPMALNDAAKRGEDVSSPEGIKSVFDQTFPGGDYNKFKYSSGPGALAFFGVDSLGFDGKPKKSKGKSRILNSEGKEVDNIEWYEYDPITHEGLFTEAGLEKFKAANPGVTPPVGVKRSSASRKDGEPNLSEPGENEKDDGLNPDGSRKLPPIPRPDKDGKCPAGYTGIDTNGDGFIDTCVAEQSQIPGAPDTQNAGPGGRVRVGGEKDTLEQASEKSSKQVFNDPTNFMRFAPSALQMMDPRYYGIKSFVPRGEEKDFNTQYRSIPGQQYANYNVVKDREKPFFAEGGLSSLHPRMNGQISGPGTEKSDDIPAMLSDGEFVVNAAAVRGIGNLMGRKKPKSKVDQRREGARTMYALQKAGEQAARMS
tara:strand:- start:278 stop:2293 length:2016 start_codon:yes stop_codon:yes gene_type:complete